MKRILGRRAALKKLQGGKAQSSTFVREERETDKDRSIDQGDSTILANPAPREQGLKCF